MQNLQEKVAIRIRELRRAAGLTQSQLAEMSGLSEDTIGALERGKSYPSLDSLQKITVALKILIKDFFDFEEEGQDIKEFKAAINRLLIHLKEKDTKDIRFFTKLMKLICDWKTPKRENFKN